MLNHSVQIYCDGSESIGFGHISRSLVLYEYLLTKNVEASIFGLSSDANNFLSAKSVDNISAKIVIFDSHSDSLNQFILKEKKLDKFVITLDWFGHVFPDINIVVFAHNTVNANKFKYIGFKYIIIKNDILMLKHSPQRNNSALVCIGGGDILDQGRHAAEILYKKGMDVTLIKGPTNMTDYSSNKFEVLIQPKDFTYLLSTASIVVTNGGGCMFESIFLKRLTFSLPQTIFESNIAKYALAHGSILGIGLESIKSFEINKKYNFLKKNLIDGKGANRIFNIIKSVQI